MSVKQKIALLTNIKCLSDAEYTALGIPYTSMARLEDILLKTKEGISANILARSWNTEGIARTARELAEAARREGTNLVITPSPKIKITPYKASVSEDPYLSGRLTGAYLSAIRDAGVSSCVSGFSLESDDVDYLDLEPSRRFIYEYFVMPFRLAMKEGECSCVIGSYSGLQNGYEDLNLELMRSAQSRFFGTGLNLLCDELTPEATAAVWYEGGIVMRGVATVLEHAYEKYNKIVQAIHKGHAAVNDLEDAYSDGSAISDEMIDMAVSRVIDFAFMCNQSKLEESEKTEETAEASTAEETAEETAEMTAEETENTEGGAYLSESLLNSIRESIVLLKNNDGILPLRSKSRVAIIGDAATEQGDGEFAEALAGAMACPCIGRAKGYLMNSDRNDDLISEAVGLAAKADVILLFLSIDRKRLDGMRRTRKPELPANQEALLEALKKYSKKTVAIVGGDVLPGAKLGDELGAFILAPLGGRSCAVALADVLTAGYNPCGRLTESYYDSPGHVYENARKNKDTKKNKIGPFMGYRLYDSVGVNVKYPFGHGLSYTKFDYSSLNIWDNNVRLVVRNSGNMRGTETVQVYVGKKDSSYVRPLKELRAFERVELNPRQSKEVILTLGDLSVYDEKKKKFVLEDGDYEIYVGSSVSDVRLTGRMIVRGDVIKSDEAPDDKSSDYLLNESNILLDKYTIEARGKKMKRSKKWMVCYIIGIILTVLADAVLAVTKIIADQSSLYLGKAVLGFIAIFNVFAISFIVLLIVADIVSKRRFRKMKEKEDREKTYEQFSDAELLEDVNIDALFVKEFDEKTEKKTEPKTKGGIDLSDYSRFVDNDMSLTVAQRALGDHAAQLGINAAGETFSNLLAAFATSRLLLLDTADGEEIARFRQLLCRYYGTEEYTEEIDGSFIDGGLLFAKDPEGGLRRTAVAEMFRAAGENKEKIYFVTLTNLTAELMTNLFSRYIRFLNNPEREASLFVNDEKFTIPENVWFVVSMSEGEGVRSIPVYMAELMTLVKFDHVYEAPVTEETENGDMQRVEADILTLGYYQLSFLCERVRNGFAFSEELWKKVDSLEEYACKHSSYRFGNKMWIRLERYLSVLNACELEPRVALDYTLSTNVVHIIRTVLDGRLQDDDMGLLEALERFFGDDNVPICRRVIKSPFLK